MGDDNATNSLTTPNYYIRQNNSTSQYGDLLTVATVQGNWMSASDTPISTSMVQKPGIHPELYFKYIKSKFGTIEKMKLDARLKRLEKAFNKAVDNGQEALGRKLMTEVMRESRESTLYAKGIKNFIEREDLWKHKRNIRGGHISDTMYKDYTRVIPEDVLAKKKKVEAFFDDFVIYHVWDNEAEKKREKSQKVTPDEKARMKDPVLFGIIRESDRLYYVAEWSDEFCDLSFEEMVDVIGKEESELTIGREPKLE